MFPKNAVIEGTIFTTERTTISLRAAVPVNSAEHCRSRRLRESFFLVTFVSALFYLLSDAIGETA